MDRERYTVVYMHKGYAICVLKQANPSDRDNLGYIIDDINFEGKSYSLVQDAINDIDKQ